jgi:hypothetical protein
MLKDYLLRFVKTLVALRILVENRLALKHNQERKTGHPFQVDFKNYNRKMVIMLGVILLVGSLPWLALALVLSPR